jgi:hypothetical protein
VRTPTSRGRRRHDSTTRSARRLAGWATAGVIAALLGTTPATAAAKATPGFYADASPGTTIGYQIYDHTNLIGGSSPRGTIAFKLYEPGDTTCQTPVFTATVTVSGTGSDNSPNYITAAAGTYEWVAAYSGDDNNNPATTPCSSASQSVIVAKTTPVATTTATLTNGAIHATTALQWGFAPPTGTITFSVTGPNDPLCSGTPVYTSTVPVNGDGNYSSGSFTPTTPGIYTYRIRYSGDSNNYGIGPTSCLATGAAVIVARAD